jgi:hypothetical protein
MDIGVLSHKFLGQASIKTQEVDVIAMISPTLSLKSTFQVQSDLARGPGV